ncbi:hypothetical protein [Bacillus cereus]|uniref:Group-specific protein n=1 Tax=Bacillus cereus TaxID=1396 RepID=A0ABD4LLR5_BACCE|nr:hypothetical protein [Bacillus cereus]MBK1611708.1 hypothetical protein [Bacillus cereus]
MFRDISYTARFIAILNMVSFSDVATVHPPSDSNHVMFWMVFGKALWMIFIYILTLYAYEAVKSLFVKEDK